MEDGRFFDDTSVDDYFKGIRQAVDREIEQLPDEQISGDIEALCAHFVDKHRVDVPVLLLDRVEIDEPVRDLRDDFVNITLYVPFAGNPALFRVRPHQSPIIYEEWTVRNGQLIFMLRTQKNRVKDLQQKKDELISQINRGLETLRDDVARHSRSIPAWVEERVRWRREKASKYDRFLQHLSEVVPIRKRTEAEGLITPLTRKVLPLPLAARPGTAGEPLIEMSAYEDILKTIQAMVSVFERSPSVFHTMKEEDLRTILLVGLNGLYEGDATGETFNGGGKTDILIRRDDRNVFIAECLIWQGEAALRKKMDEQLFQYATWRDSKLALLIFNRNKGFSDVIAKMKATVGAHSLCIRPLPYSGESAGRFEFRRADDPQRRFIVTCLAFNVPR